MSIFGTTILFVCQVFSTATLHKVKEWGGITPLLSTRSDVERLLGPSTKPSGSTYKTDNESVFITYSNGTCEQDPRSRWNVPRDTVIQISVYPKKEQRFTDLHIDESNYKKEEDPHRLGSFYYTNDKDGHIILVNQGLVRSMYYGPTDDDVHLHCPNTENPPGKDPSSSIK